MPRMLEASAAGDYASRRASFRRGHPEPDVNPTPIRQQLLGAVLDGLHLPEDRFDDRLAPRVRCVCLLGLEPCVPPRRPSRVAMPVGRAPAQASLPRPPPAPGHRRVRPDQRRVPSLDLVVPPHCAAAHPQPDRPEPMPRGDPAQPRAGPQLPAIAPGSHGARPAPPFDDTKLESLKTRRPGHDADRRGLSAIEVLGHEVARCEYRHGWIGELEQVEVTGHDGRGAHCVASARR